jgi:hypothetical protein
MLVRAGGCRRVMEEFLVRIAAFPTVVFTALVVLSLLYWGLVIVSGLGVDSALDGVGEAIGSAALLGWLGFGRAPLGVLLSVWSLSAWAACYLLAAWLEPHGAWAPLAEAGIGGLALVVTAPVVHLVADRLAPVFEGAPAESRLDLVGRTCVITTGTVDPGFGQARLEEAGDWRVIQVRARQGQLARGDRALVVAWDEALDAFRVEAMKND